MVINIDENNLEEKVKTKLHNENNKRQTLRIKILLWFGYSSHKLMLPSICFD